MDTEKNPSTTAATTTMHAEDLGESNLAHLANQEDHDQNK
jgi:SP family general alpha glucoside:H+ symporter-like MFS transporter